MFLPGGGYPCELLAGVCRPVLQTSLNLFQTKKCHFPQQEPMPWAHQIWWAPVLTYFQSWPLRNLNYVIIIWIKMPTKRFLKIHLKFSNWYFILINLELKWEICSYIPIVPLKAIPGFRQKGLYPYADWNGAKPYSLGWHIFLWLILGSYPTLLPGVLVLIPWHTLRCSINPQSGSYGVYVQESNSKCQVKRPAACSQSIKVRLITSGLFLLFLSPLSETR